LKRKLTHTVLQWAAVIALRNSQDEYIDFVFSSVRNSICIEFFLKVIID